MKRTPTIFMLAALLSLSVNSQAASFNCAKAKSYSEKEVCDSKQLSKLDDDLDKVFKKVLAATSNKANLKTEQADWLKEREACADKSCITDIYQSRIEELNTQLENVSDTNISSGDSVSLGWYKASAKPSLVVRATPSVTGEKMGNVPVDGKVNVIATTGKADSIGGREGQWVKIQWQGKEGYVFSAFITKLSGNESATSKPSKATSKSLTGKISGYECGDNCYLTIKDSQGTEHSGLCTASACDKWNENAEMPNSFIGKKVTVTVGRGNQVDGSGNSMGEMDAFDKIEILN